MSWFVFGCLSKKKNLHYLYIWTPQILKYIMELLELNKKVEIYFRILFLKSLVSFFYSSNLYTYLVFMKFKRLV